MTNQVKKRRRFSRTIQERANRIIREGRNNWRGPVAMLQAYGLIAVSIACPYLTHSTIAWSLVYIAVSVPMIGAWQRAMATLLHDSSHGSLAKNRVINFVCGAVFCGYPILQSWHAFKKSHTSHHINLGDELRDPDYRFLLAQGVYEETSVLRFVWRFLIAPLLLLKTPAKIIDLVRNRFLSANEPRAERYGKIVFLATVCSAIVAMGFGWELVLFWLVPLVTTFPIVNWYNELFEHFPYVAESDDEMYMTRNRWVGPIARFLTCQFNEHLHQTHHLFPHASFWVLPQLHEILMEDSEYRATQQRDIGLIVPAIQGIPSIIANICRRVARRRQATG